MHSTRTDLWSSSISMVLSESSMRSSRTFNLLSRKSICMKYASKRFSQALMSWGSMKPRPSAQQIFEISTNEI